METQSNPWGISKDERAAWAEFEREYFNNKEQGKMSESDPNGKGQHEAGAKLDDGKPRADLVLGGFSRALIAVIEIGTKGAIKYTDNGWMTVPKGKDRYADAQLRHYLKRKGGEERDTDSKQLHLAHEAWNVLAQLELCLRECESQVTPYCHNCGGVGKECVCLSLPKSGLEQGV